MIVSPLSILVKSAYAEVNSSITIGPVNGVPGVDVLTVPISCQNADSGLLIIMNASILAIGNNIYDYISVYVDGVRKRTHEQFQIAEYVKEVNSTLFIKNIGQGRHVIRVNVSSTDGDVLIDPTYEGSTMFASCFVAEIKNV